MNWTLIIPTWHRAAMLRSLLGQLGRQTCRDFDVVVVCDGPDEETRRLRESGSHDFDVRWIFHRENLGLAAARNTGAQASSGDLLLFLDDDVVPAPDLLQAHRDAHAEAPDWPSSVVCGRIIEDRQTPFFSKTDEFLQRAWERSLAEALPAHGMLDTNSVGTKAELSTWFGLNCSIRRELFATIGGFDSKLRSDEELELGLRLYRAGVQTRYASNAVVRHRGTKDQSSYYPGCWGLSGKLDVYRARERDERSSQLSQLTGPSSGAWLRRILTAAAWQSPELLLSLASSLEKITNTTGSRLSFAAWARLRHLGEYWQAVRSTSISRQELDSMGGFAGRILLFHSLSQPQCPREATYYVSPSRFRRFLAWLEWMQYVHVSPDQWLAGTRPEGNVLLTFDDGYEDLYTELTPQISRYRLRPLVFVVVDRIGQKNQWDQTQGLRQRSLLSLEQVLQMQRQGVVFGSHSLTHRPLTSLSTSELRREVNDSKSKLEDLLGARIDWFAYPYGDLDRRVRAAVLEAGYRAAVTTNGGFNRWQDPLALNRLEVDDRDWLLDFALKIATGRNYRRGLLNRLK
jgi:GT2 family glycosyltransferase/peptidoglycan/xylan/chitin deacetylase (PgdA/CDA1 family)